MAAPSLPDPQALAVRLTRTLARTKDLLESEVGSIADLHVETLMALRTQKRDLARDLREATSFLSANAEVAEQWGTAQREELRRSLLAMRAAVDANARTLGVKVETGRHLMDAVARAVRNKSAEGKRYDPAARTTIQPAGGRAKSVLINQVA